MGADGSGAVAKRGATSKGKTGARTAAGKRRLTLVGGKRPRLQAAASTAWTKAKAKAFLGVLAETCNVSEACRQSAISVSAAYNRLKSDAAFRAGWLEAISSAYQQLELVLLDRAFNGTEKMIKRRDGNDEVMLEYSNQLGLSLLKMHRDTAVEADTSFEPDEIEQLRARLINKLERMRKRDAAVGRDGTEISDGAVETKADRDWARDALRKLAVGQYGVSEEKSGATDE